MKSTRRRTSLILAGSIAALFAVHSAQANTEDDVINGQSDLTLSTTYTGGLPGTTSDVTFTSQSYAPAMFTVPSNLSIGTLDDLATNALTITGGGNSTTLTLNGGANSVSGANAADLIYVQTSDFTIGDAVAPTMGLALAASGNFDIAAGTTTINSVISDSGGGFTKTGAGALVLTAADTYTGTTKIAAGTLTLSGGNDRLLNTGTVNFTGSSTLNLNGPISQTLANLTVANGVTGTVTGATGTLTVTGASMSIGGTATNTTQTLDLSGLGTFNYNNSAGNFYVGGTLTTGNATQTGTVKLAPTSTITASTVGVGSIGGGNGNGFSSQGTLTLGTTATINADTITLGANLAKGTINYASGTTNPMLTLRGSTGGSSRVTNLVIGQSAGFTNTESSTVDLTTNVTRHEHPRREDHDLDHRQLYAHNQPFSFSHYEWHASDGRRDARRHHDHSWSERGRPHQRHRYDERHPDDRRHLGRRRHRQGADFVSGQSEPQCSHQQGHRDF